jgi:hypothetical protein
MTFVTTMFGMDNVRHGWEEMDYLHITIFVHLHGDWV